MADNKAGIRGYLSGSGRSLVLGSDRQICRLNYTDPSGSQIYGPAGVGNGSRKIAAFGFSQSFFYARVRTAFSDTMTVMTSLPKNG